MGHVAEGWPDRPDHPCEDAGSVLSDVRGLSEGLSRGIVSDSLGVGGGARADTGKPDRRLLQQSCPISDCGMIRSGWVEVMQSGYILDILTVLLSGGIDKMVGGEKAGNQYDCKIFV